MPGYVFGDWDSPIVEDHTAIAAPVGKTCLWCQQDIREGDSGRIGVQVTSSGGETFVEHRECGLRVVVGGIGHLVDHSRYCRGEHGTDAGLSVRESSLLVWDFISELEPLGGDWGGMSTERREAWKRRVDDTREMLR